MQLVTRRCLNGLGRRKIDFHSFGGGKRGEATIFFKVAPHSFMGLRASEARDAPGQKETSVIKVLKKLEITSPSTK